MLEINPFRNIMALTDSYKEVHWNLTEADAIYSYFESRGGRFPFVLFFGLQYILKEYLEGQVVTQNKIDEAETLINAHFGAEVFNRDGWEYILREHGGKLPIRIKAVPEGTCVPVQNVLLTVESTDPACAWLPGFVETLLVQLWYPCTVATHSYELRKLIDWYLDETGDPSGAAFKVHDFGFRGGYLPWNLLQSAAALTCSVSRALIPFRL